MVVRGKVNLAAVRKRGILQHCEGKKGHNNNKKEKVNLAAVPKEKNSHVYASKEKSGFCSSC